MTDLDFRGVHGVLELDHKMEQSKTGNIKRQYKQKKFRGKYLPRLNARQIKKEMRPPV